MYGVFHITPWSQKSSILLPQFPCLEMQLSDYRWKTWIQSNLPSMKSDIWDSIRPSCGGWQQALLKVLLRSSPTHSRLRSHGLHPMHLNYLTQKHSHHNNRSRNRWFRIQCLVNCSEKKAIVQCLSPLIIFSTRLFNFKTLLLLSGENLNEYLLHLVQNDTKV